MQFDFKIKYLTYKIDILNREKQVIEEHFFAVIKKIYYPAAMSPTNLNSIVPYYYNMSDTIHIKYFILDRDGKLEVLDEIEDRLKFKSVNDLNFWMSATKELALENIKTVYEQYRTTVAYDAKVYLVTEQ